MLGLKYLNALEGVDCNRMEEEILNYELKENIDAERIYEIPMKLNLPNAIIIRNKIASRFGMKVK